MSGDPRYPSRTGSATWAAGLEGIFGMNKQLFLEVLARIPRQPDRIDTISLLERLRAAGVDTNVRTLQRLLKELETEGVVQRAGRGKPHQWSWPKDWYVEFPPMTPEAALSTLMAFEHVRNLLPPPTSQDLKPRAKRAEKVLAAAATYQKWRSKVHVAPPGLRTLPPDIPQDVLQSVYEALFQGRQLTVEYRLRGRKDYRRFDVNPLGIVVCGGTIALISTRTGTTSMQQLMLHRMRNPELTPERVRVPAGFSLKDHVLRGNTSYKKSPEPIVLELLISETVAHTVSERRLSKDQTLEPSGDGWFRLRATLPDTMDLRGWLKSYGPDVEVVGPARVREEIGRELREAAKRYADGRRDSKRGR